MGRSLGRCHLCRRRELPEQAVFTVRARYHMTFGHTVWLTVAANQGPAQGPAQAPRRLRVWASAAGPSLRQCGRTRRMVSASSSATNLAT